jgi:D-psicose/D-tagatose/L-ribulose 3-epimerase
MPLPLRLAYNTNGTASHRLEDAVDLIASAGYDGVALTLDVHHLDPLRPMLPSRALQLRQRLDELGLGSVIETGARYLLDPRAKHEPTLLTPDPDRRAVRVDFLKAAVDVAAILGSEAVSFWAGVPLPGVSQDDAWTWLLDGVERVREHAAAKGVVVCLEPEPGHLVGSLDDLDRLPDDLLLALDVGHCLVTQEADPAEAIRELAPRLGSVTIDDMRRGTHVHLPFGEGDLDLEGVLAALVEVGWQGLTCVELSRDSHRADTMVPQAFRAVEEALAQAVPTHGTAT